MNKKNKLMDKHSACVQDGRDQAWQHIYYDGINSWIALVDLQLNVTQDFDTATKINVLGYVTE